MQELPTNEDGDYTVNLANQIEPEAAPEEQPEGEIKQEEPPVLEEIIPEELYCGNTSGQFLKSDKNYITADSKNFKDKLAKIDSNFINKGYNLIVISGLKPTGGFSLKLKNINKKKDILHINFIDIKPADNSKVTMATTYPYCVLRIENLEKFKISIK